MINEVVNCPRPVQKRHCLTRPTPARQDVPFPRARPQAAKEDEAYGEQYGESSEQ